ncbi:MAG: hypothetical protein Q6353_018120 [Candidatus Sigynarchaeum springense]
MGFARLGERIFSSLERARFTGHGTIIKEVLIFGLYAATGNNDVALIIGVVAGIAVGIVVVCTIAVLKKRHPHHHRT